MNIRVGHGVDIHQLKDNIPLILAGINIKSNFGIVGHSDGDVVIHAVVDSILGALSKGDIGTFFPSSDNRWKNANSSIFLDHTVNLMEKENYKISNIDINIYDINGRLVENLFNGFKSAGSYSFNWDANNVPSGVYFLNMNANSFSSTQKLMLIK